MYRTHEELICQLVNVFIETCLCVSRVTG